MGYIKKDKDIKILVLVFFILAFFLFLFVKPEITGMVVVDSLSISDIEEGNSLEGSDIISLIFNAGDVIPCLANVSIIIKDPSSNSIQSDIMVLESFLGSGCENSQDFNDVNHDNQDWEDLTGRGFSSGISSVTKTKTVSSFSNLSENFDTIGIDYIFEVSLIFGSENIHTNSDQFDVTEAATVSEEPTITDINFVTEEDGDSFVNGDTINCSSIVTDSDSDSVTVKYIFWDDSDISTPYKSGSISCSGDDWSTGKSCNASITITTTERDEWACTIEANDGSNNVQVPAGPTLIMENHPPELTDEIDNVTWSMNKNWTDIDLYDYFNDPDDPNDELLDFTFDGNESIQIEIEDDGDVKLIPEEDWVGIEIVIFTADDGEDDTDSNDVLLNVTDQILCVPDWNCTDWGGCINAVQTRTCNDLNDCDIPSFYESTIKNCTSTLTATCSSGDLCKTDCVDGDADCSCDIQNGNLCGSSMTCEVSTLLSSDSGICCSEPCTSTVDTNVEGEGGFGFGANTSKILMGVGTVAGIVFVITIIIIVITFLRRKNAKVVDGGSSALGGTKPSVTPGTKPGEKPKEESVVKPLISEPVKVRPVNFEKMKKYIEKSLMGKVPLRIIKSELEKAGWGKKEISNELSIARLRNYVKIKVNQGVSKKDIEHSLKMKGWTKEQIKEVLKEAKLRPLF